MTFADIHYAVDRGIAMITLDRPDQLNALTPRMVDELIAAFDAVDADDAVRAVIVTGRGRAFCAGADLGDGTASFDPATWPDSPVREDGSIDYAKDSVRDGGGRVTLRIFDCLKPVIAAINGPAVGVGVTLTLAMDVRFASTAARFGFVFARRGIVPEAASSFFLPRIVGIARALEWCMAGEVFPAAEALDGGLVRAVVAPDDLLQTATAYARRIADTTAPVSVALTRQMLWRGMTMAHPMEAHRIDSRAIAARSRSGDLAEGISSFLQKRPACFPDQVSRDMPDIFPWWDEQPYS